MSVEIYGITGAKGAGKDTLARAIDTAVYICNVSGATLGAPFVIEHFADPLKRMTCRVFGLTPEQVYDPVLKEAPLRGEVAMDQYTQAMKDETGLAIKPRGLIANTPRQLLQFFGTDYVRTVCDDFWVQRLIATISGSNRVLVPDLRFPNEATALRKLGAKIIRVERVGAKCSTEHESEAHWKRIEADLVLRTVTGNLEIVNAAADLIAANKFDQAVQNFHLDNVSVNLSVGGLANVPDAVTDMLVRYYGVSGSVGHDEDPCT